MAIKHLQLCHSDRVFFERVLNRQGALLRHRCAPLSSKGHFHSGVCVTAPVSQQCCAASPGVQMFLLSACDVCTLTPAWLCPGAQTGLSSTQTNILCHSPIRHICACVYVIACLPPYIRKLCVTNLLIVYMPSVVINCTEGLCYLVYFCADSPFHLVTALDHAGIRFWHFVSQLIFGHVRAP